MKRLIFFWGMLLMSLCLWAQTDLLDGGDSLDDLLGGDDMLETEEETEAVETVSVIDDLIDTESLDIKLTSKLTVGYTPGLSDVSEGTSSFEDSPILELSSSLILDYKISSELRSYIKWSLSSPDFDMSLSEMFTDYYPADFVSFRAGRFTETWGESKNFSHTNLIDREPEDFSGSTDTLAFRAMIPWKTGFVEALAFTREGYWEDADYPALDEFGWGLRVNPPVPNADLTFAVYAHPELNLRGTASFKTTLFGSLETYGEALLSIDKDLYYGDYDADKVTDDGKVDNAVDYSLNLGLYRDFFDGRLSLGGEYYFNGEESELDLASGTWDLYYGHNLALYAKWKQNDWELFSYGRYNFYEESGMIGPGLNWYFSDAAKLQTGGGWAWGDAYGSSNPDDFDRELFMFLQLVISGSWNTTL